MSISTIPINSKTSSYIVEANPDNSGIRFAEVRDGVQAWLASIIDNGDNFVLSTLQPNGILMQTFKPTKRLFNKDGTMPALEVEKQIEVKTAHGRTIVVRYLYKDESPSGVMIAYSDGICLWQLAMCGAPNDGLRFSISN